MSRNLFNRFSMRLKSMTLGGVMVFAVISSPVAVQAETQVPSSVEKAIQNQLAKVIPGAPTADIAKTPVDGLYQVTVGLGIIYMSADGQFLLNGSMINLKTDENLTKSAMSELRQTAMAKIPVDSMVVYPGKNSDNGKKGRFMTVFTDIDCPYCAKLHNEIPALNEAGVTVRYLAYPRSGVNTKSYNKAVSVWCSDDRTKTMDLAMSKKKIETKSCENPVKGHMMQAQRFGVNGTPNIVLDSGELLPGYVPADELLKIFNNPS
ncbi:DsbC family protein [Thiomicrorhabdus indica]|uniref:DsbC family protein n=1 Tax=Thiomicrorhabdus indica TaxID=2267253 RepID=UPI002AA85054|nr:DsbC family protein [Thiomicrorhabdus indica]